MTTLHCLIFLVFHLAFFLCFASFASTQVPPASICPQMKPYSKNVPSQMPESRSIWTGKPRVVGKVTSSVRANAPEGKGTKRKANDRDLPINPSNVLPTVNTTGPSSIASPRAGGQEASARSTTHVDEDVRIIANAVERGLVEDMKKRGGTSIHRDFSVEIRRVLAVEQALLESLETTSRSHSEALNVNSQLENVNSQLEKELSDSKRLLDEKEKLLAEKDSTISSLQGEFERRLEVRAREVVESYKFSPEFDEIAGMFRVKSMIHAYKKVKYCLSRDHPAVDFDEFEDFANAERGRR